MELSRGFFHKMIFNLSVVDTLCRVVDVSFMLHFTYKFYDFSLQMQVQVVYEHYR